MDEQTIALAAAFNSKGEILLLKRSNDDNIHRLIINRAIAHIKRLVRHKNSMAGALYKIICHHFELLFPVMSNLHSDANNLPVLYPGHIPVMLGACELSDPGMP